MESLTNDLALLRWPDDKSIIAGLSLSEKIYWYASLNSQDVIFMANTKEFQRFWYWRYLVPLRIKRFLYKVKYWLSYSGGSD